jgi:hypothetical protein
VILRGRSELGLKPILQFSFSSGEIPYEYAISRTLAKPAPKLLNSHRRSERVLVETRNALAVQWGRISYVCFQPPCKHLYPSTPHMPYLNN